MRWVIFKRISGKMFIASVTIDIVGLREGCLLFRRKTKSDSSRIFSLNCLKFIDRISINFFSYNPVQFDKTLLVFILERQLLLVFLSYERNNKTIKNNFKETNKLTRVTLKLKVSTIYVFLQIYWRLYFHLLQLIHSKKDNLLELRDESAIYNRLISID